MATVGVLPTTEPAARNTSVQEYVSDEPTACRNGRGKSPYAVATCAGPASTERHTRPSRSCTPPLNVPSQGEQCSNDSTSASSSVYGRSRHTDGAADDGHGTTQKLQG